MILVIKCNFYWQTLQYLWNYDCKLCRISTFSPSVMKIGTYKIYINKLGEMLK